MVNLESVPRLSTAVRIIPLNLFKKSLTKGWTMPHRAAWSTGLVLENLKLKTEAFDYLQLPFAINEGSLARLDVQVLCEQLSAILGECP